MIPLIDKIKPKNNGNFPLVDAEDVLMPDGSRLSDTEMGKPGSDGKDGVSATHSWSGTTLTITSASGTSSADLKGEAGKDGKDGQNGQDGQDGYTPIRGVDYFNEEDIAVIKGYIDGLFVPLTQEEYDALATVDPNKYYMIVGDSQ